MKRIIALMLSISMILMVLSGCGRKENAVSETTPQANVTTVPATIQIQIPQQTTEPKESVDIIETFIEIYNTDSDTQITDISELDIHGDDYRPEYRLNSFKNAVGKKGVIPSGNIEIVNYGSWSNDSIRFYAHVNTLEDAVLLYRNLVHIFDNSITDEEIDKELSPFEHVNSVNFYLGESRHISGYISKTYANGGPDGYKVMFDCTKIGF